MIQDYSNDHNPFYGIENHFKSILNSASEIILSIDMDGTILTWNTSAENTFGYSYEDVKARSLFDYLEGEQLDELKKIMSHMIITGSPTKRDCKLVGKNGGLSFISWVCSPIKNHHSQITGMVIIGRDITEHRLMESRIHQSQKLAALGLMAGGIAHEIRNPLAICSSAAQFLMAEDLDVDFRKECAAKIHKGMTRASNIIDTLLNFARPSVRAKIEQVDLHDLMRETISRMVKQAEAGQITIVKEFYQEPVSIICNQNLLQHVFMSLFDNSIKAMSEGGILTISTTVSGSEVCSRIMDTGHGISGEAIDRIFDPFYTYWPDEEGTGLSLSLCYAIVKEHDGHIEVDSAEGRGTVFTIHFPLAV